MIFINTFFSILVSILIQKKEHITTPHNVSKNLPRKSSTFTSPAPNKKKISENQSKKSKKFALTVELIRLKYFFVASHMTPEKVKGG